MGDCRAPETPHRRAGGLTVLVVAALATGCIDEEATGKGSLAEEAAGEGPDGDGDGFTTADGDCDDANAAVHPAATELCNEVDDDCNGYIDDDSENARMWFPDSDGDGAHNDVVHVEACTPPEGFIAPSSPDCDDENTAVFPGAEEVCDGIDNNCDGLVDEAGIEGERTYYRDADGDGYGDPALSQVACSPPEGWVEDATDCDDSTGAVHPGADEVCGDGLDNDCDGGPGTCALRGEYGPQDAAAALRGASGDGAGSSLALAGDVDGDGVQDVLIGAWASDRVDLDAGAVFLVSGDAAGDSELEADSTAVLLGESRGDQAGIHVAGLGDIDGDGYDDVLVGANGWEADTSTRNQGAAYLLTGPLTGELSLTSADARFAGGQLTDFAGSATAAVGDLTGDGRPDLAVGAYGEDSGGDGAGAVYLLSSGLATTLGPTDAFATLVGGAAGDGLGHAIAGGGDFDGDGLPDLLVGARSSSASGLADSGSAYLFSGPLTGSLSAADADSRFLGSSESDQAGFSLDLSADLNDDGIADAVIGAPGALGTVGTVYVVYGPATGDLSLASADAVLIGESTGDQAGRSLTHAGDVNGDRVDDLLVGAYGLDRGATNAGGAYLLHGPLSGTRLLSTADARFLGDTGGQVSASALAGGADLDGDGLDDMLIGAPGDDGAAENAGAVWIWAGYGQ